MMRSQLKNPHNLKFKLRMIKFKSNNKLMINLYQAQFLLRLLLQILSQTPGKLFKNINLLLILFLSQFHPLPLKMNISIKKKIKNIKKIEDIEKTINMKSPKISLTIQPNLLTIPKKIRKLK